MEFVFAVQNEEELRRYRQFAERYQPVVESYIQEIKSRFDVKDLPCCIVLASRRIATELISDVPIPAYTNDRRIVFTPETEIWRDLYLRQLEDYEENEQVREIRHYYKKMNDHHLLQILGHELAHHSDYFSDEAYENGGAWFEEGMVEYISRKLLWTDELFAEEEKINRMLVRLYENTYPERPIASFGDSLKYATIYYDYWRAFLKVSKMVDERHGDIKAVLLHQPY